MMTLNITTLYNGKEARATLVGSDERVLHNAPYRSADDAIWNGMRWALRLTHGIRGVYVDGTKMRLRDIEDKLWAHLGGEEVEARPSDVKIVTEMMSMLELGESLGTETP